MKIQEMLAKEWDYLAPHANKAITISNTANSVGEFKVLPRRYALDTAVACFLINERDFLEQTIAFFDGKVETIYVDVEHKQAIDLFKKAKNLIHESNLIAFKPNDMTLEACDLLLRHHFEDDISERNVLVIGTGNLASKIALRTAERQANVFMDGRLKTKESLIINGINNFLPAFSPSIKTFKQMEKPATFDAIISFLAGEYWAEEELLSYIDENTFIIDGGISNFSTHFVQKVVSQNIRVTRLDVRIALAHQFISTMNSTTAFFKDIYGRKYVDTISVVSGGFIGEEGAVIVDQIARPTQVIGIADGMGGVKDTDSLTDTDQEAMIKIQKSISNGWQ